MRYEANSPPIFTSCGIAFDVLHPGSSFWKGYCDVRSSITWKCLAWRPSSAASAVQAWVVRRWALEDLNL
jgi:hypothetical protein